MVFVLFHEMQKRESQLTHSISTCASPNILDEWPSSLWGGRATFCQRDTTFITSVHEHVQTFPS